MEHYSQIHAVLEAIDQGQRFLVTSHARPDGDAIGSILACGMLLEQLGKRADLVSSDRVPLIYRGLPCATQIRCTPRVDGHYDAAILLECDSTERTGLKGLEGYALVSIDHHASARRFAAIDWIDQSACAVAEMIYELALAAGARITSEMATCLYTAVLTDTGSFCYRGTSERTFKLARELVLHGADPMACAQEVYFTNPMSKMLLLGAALSNLKREGRLAWMWVTHSDMVRTRAAEEDCEGIVNYAIGISGVDVAVFLRELPDHRVRISLRSKSQIDVAAFAARLGGGGHTNASGCTLEVPLTEAIDRTLAQLRKEIAGSIHDVA